MNKKRALFWLQLLFILVLTSNSSIAQGNKTAKSGSSINKSISKINDLSLQHWNLIEINGLKIKNAQPFIEFIPVRGQIGGSLGCNRMFGKFEASGNTIKLTGIGATRMLCSAEGVMKLESDFIRALEKVTRFELKGDALNLFAGNEMILRFSGASKSVPGNENSNTVKQGDKKWVLVSIAGKPLPKIEKTPFLVLNKQEKSAGGDTGCNSYGGRYKTKGNKIIITEIISTMRACFEDERNNVERELLDGLRRANRFEITAGKLNLYEADKLLLTFVAVAKT